MPLLYFARFCSLHSVPPLFSCSFPQILPCLLCFFYYFYSATLHLMKARPCPYGDAVLTEKGEWQYYPLPERIKAYRNAEDLKLRPRAAEQ